MATDAGTGLMHEGFHKDDPARFTRPWFAWANSMFAEFVMRVAGVVVEEVPLRPPFKQLGLPSAHLLQNAPPFDDVLVIPLDARGLVQPAPQVC